jgi:DNA polymerase-1
MLSFSNGVRLVQELNELPNLMNAENLYVDFETRSYNCKESAFKPHHGHKIAGVCITADDMPGAWYIPVRCARDKWNLPVDNVMQWLKCTVTSAKRWINHNIKFDAHFARYDGIDFGNTELVDTVVLAKLIDSDRLKYDLDSLSRDWLEDDISRYDERVQAYLSGCKSKDYGDVPGDVIGEYGGQDVITNRKLYQHILRRRDSQTVQVWDTEVALTPVLFDMEVTGMRVDRTELIKKEVIILDEMLRLEEQLHEVTGIAMRPHMNPDCFEVLCNKYGLPVLGWTDTGDPSFDKDTLISYQAHPDVQCSHELTTIVTKIQRYRHINTLLTFFVRPYQEHEVNGIMHPDYNQTVRTGRMSCRRPNAQQLSPEAKELVYPLKGYDFVRYDYSQIEFRLIVHYIQALDAIQAYNDNPDTDFHTWVAEMCGIPRKPAKNVNFAIAFGGGKDKIVSMLSANMELVGAMSKRVEEFVVQGKIEESQRQQTFALLCRSRGEQVYNQYLAALPTLKGTMRRASNNLKVRGYVFNAYGRQRRLPVKAAFRAFNTVIQSSAADVMKERAVATAPRYNKWIRDLGILPCAYVHDESLNNVPKEISQDLTVLKKIAELYEDTAIKFRVPIRTSCGRSSKNWKEASSDAGDVKFKEAT